MPAPTPYILVHCDPVATVITRIGLLTEVNQPIMLTACTARASLSTDRLEDYYGDLYAQAWGGRKLSYDLSMDQFAQWGISDSYLGRIDPTLLANLAVNFGMSAASSGTALLTQASRELIPAKIAKVNLSIEVEDTKDHGFGSPDGPSTPAWASGTAPAGTKPTINGTTDGTIALAGTIGTPFSYTVTATGTAVISIAPAPGQTTPPGLTMVGATVSGTPTGEATQWWTEVRASNAYGSTFALLHFTIAAVPVAPPLPVQAYVRYLVDSGQTTVPDGFWARSYSGMSPAPTDQTSFLAGTPASSGSVASDPGTPTNPNALSGTTGGGRLWNITEIYGRNPTTGVYSYWFQRGAADTTLADAVTRGVDILGDATVEQVVGENIGVTGPGAPTPPSWPGVIKPSARVEQYYIWKNYLTGKTTGAGLGGDQTYPDLPSFLAAFPYLHLSYTETQTTVLLEYYRKSGSGTPGYIYQNGAGNTKIATQLGSTLSPIYNGVDIPGGVSTSLPEVAPNFTVVGLPPPLGTSSGPAPAAETWLYVLERAWNGARQCWGLHAHAPADLNLHRLLGVYGKITSRANHDECTYGMPWVEEVWMRFTAVAGNAWQCYWLDPTLYPTTAWAPIGNSLADNVSPVNNPLVAPGLVYSDSTIVW